MTRTEFSSTLDQPLPPEGLTVFLQALWYEAKGDWHKAHHLVQDEENSSGAWVHAYLHRKEGDASNAAFWYRRANKKMPHVPLQQEWEDLADEFLKRT
jgi:hypothetical protein